MHPIHHAPMTGIVFRRLRSPAEREAARRLLADRGAPPLRVRMPGETVLYGLWDLAAPNGERLVAVAATQRLDDAGSVALCGIVVRADLRRRGWAGGLSPRWPTPCGPRVPPAWSSGWTVTTGQRRPC
jgi:hypothetical protein